VSDLRNTLEQTLSATYRMVRELGGGGMSRVFLAVETALEREVVIKVLPPELAGSVSTDRFKREMPLVAKLQHPNSDRRKSPLNPNWDTGNRLSVTTMAFPVTE
jgi:eukaryotic-like serine/threonine-protein kinase